MHLRASGVAPLYSGTDGLTDAQKARIEELTARQELAKVDKKKELTDNMKAELLDLLAKKKRFEDGEIDLPAGAITLLNKAAKKHVYGYKSSPFKGSRATNKGNDCESPAISFLNITRLTSWRKLEEGDEFYSVGYGLVSGHPDVVEDLEVYDIKVPETKDSFPEFEEDGRNTDYEWQVRQYLYNLRKITGKDYRRGAYVYVLMSTPEELMYEEEPDDLHYCDDLDDNLRYTICWVDLTDDHIAHMDRRLAAAEKYINNRIEKLTNKNK